MISENESKSDKEKGKRHDGGVHLRRHRSRHALGRHLLRVRRNRTRRSSVFSLLFGDDRRARARSLGLVLFFIFEM